jgi:hypothetical protein
MNLRFLSISGAVALIAFSVAVLSPSPVRAKQPPMPPGMTPAVMKMVMTPGPAHPKGMPADLKPYLGCIPTMGYHYVNPKNAPFGPIYGWYNGKAIFTEIMVDQRSFNKGMSWDSELKPLPGYAINHVDVWYEPHGHPGYTIPHYDIHAWYVPHEEHMYYCNNTSGKKPTWL